MLKLPRFVPWLILSAAWITAAVSMVLPAYVDLHQPAWMFQTTPMLVLPLAGLNELFKPRNGTGLEPFVLFGMIFLLASPLFLLVKLVAPKASKFVSFLSLGLLLPWGVPIGRVCFPVAFSQMEASDTVLGFGFYLYAASQTLAFVACCIPVKRSQRALGLGGFTVAVPQVVERTND